ncbi:unnamed protein product [Bursaphelenchus okinawaensis]|uniref:Polypeptide N-acetylgalactosaminyltransferase n=1 Tax=Bursaphelenchus okinawaensis TaxID=465554 RepID=A0A811KV94_9BILA|nr:unnamed protein product [Bursaphelenchus okinawaensis]CAG9112403.1 unnamed protein product [Bursaphelenchus okinawaensis]
MIRRKIGRYLPKKQLIFLFYCFFLLTLLFIYKVIVKEHDDNNNNVAQPFTLYDGLDPFQAYKKITTKKDWHDYEAMEMDKRRTGLGEHGQPIIYNDTPDEAKKRKDLYLVNGYDGYASDLIALDRSVYDNRHPGCKKVNYLSKLPTVTVIFPFHNEHNSTLLRSIYSIINRCPKDVMKEIVLVDDASTKPELKESFEEYLRTHGLSDIVKIVRTQKREGLIRARQFGARAATKEILVFLDAHSEANYNWLPPLIEPITLDYRTVVCPFVDIVDCDTYQYRSQDEGARGSFDWSFSYKRLPVTKEDQMHPTRPFNSPVMAGGYFAISAKWFWELGGYDEGLDIWGGEQYELSFKTWQCHGKMVDAPCSRVGHIYRCKYIPFPNPGVGDFISRNYKRVAEVWMDEYKEFLYKRRPEMRDTDPGDLTKQRAIRERLQCKSFDWYMKNVAFDQDLFYPNVEPPDSANGSLRNVEINKCVDTDFREQGKTFGLRKCMEVSTFMLGEQKLRMAFQLDIKVKNDKNLCFDVSQYTERAPVLLFGCHGTKGNQMFRYLITSRQIYHPLANMCLDADPRTDQVFMSKCVKTKRTQQWRWSYLDKELMEKRNQIPM